jgi:hypothetical protein
MIEFAVVASWEAVADDIILDGHASSAGNTRCRPQAAAE